MTFNDLGLIEPLTAAVRAEGYTVPTPIQVKAIPHVLAGRDLLGLAQTGTGKTAAFALPILQRLHQLGYRPHGDRPIRVLVLTPTRELAAQIGDSFAAYGKNLGYRHTVVFGGVGQSAQERALRSGIDVLVATPGRLLDLAGQKLIRLAHLDVFVLDEADRMLDMGFIHDVRKVIALLPPVRQTLFFSATMPPEAQKLADVLLKNPETVSVAPRSATADRIDQMVYFVDKNDKRSLAAEVLRDRALSRVLLFTRTKHGANRVAEYLDKAGVSAEAIHGNKSQGARERALANFKKGATRVLVATDIAARGLDIDDISHVINFDLPNVPETYVHRIGRTARAGASGIAISFCDGEEREFLVDIERLTRRSIPVAAGYALRPSVPPPAQTPRPPRGLPPRRLPPRAEPPRGLPPRGLPPRAEIHAPAKPAPHRGPPVGQPPRGLPPRAEIHAPAKPAPHRGPLVGQPPPRAPAGDVWADERAATQRQQHGPAAPAPAADQPARPRSRRGRRGGRRPPSPFPRG